MSKLRKLLAKLRARRDAPPASLKPYRVETAPDLSAYFEGSREAYNNRGEQNSFQYHCELLDRLRREGGNLLVPMKDLERVNDPHRRVVSLRLDVDADPLTALRMARLHARYGVPSTVYLLHTATYYGTFIGETFARNPELKRWVEGLIVAGCEIGLHVDALGLSFSRRVDGVSAVRDELVYLRSLGAIITGTCSHNSAPVYGAENFEIFRGRNIWGRKEVVRDGGRAVLGALDEAELGLTYEANAVTPTSENPTREALEFLSAPSAEGLRDPAWARHYLLENPYCTWGPDYQFWLIGRDKWVFAGNAKDDPAFAHAIGLEAVLEALGRIERGSKVVFCIHPIYVSG